MKEITMAEHEQKITQNTTNLQTKHLYRLGAISSIILAGSILFSIIAFFIWPYKAGMVSTESIFNLLQTDRLGGLISLDLPMLLIIPVNILPMLVLYYSLKRVNEFYALLALVIGLVGVALLISTRPLVELVNLSDQFAATANEAIRNRYLASGDLLLGLFSGTAWVFQTVFFLISGIINAILMLQCPIFRQITALTNLTISIIGLGFFLPVVGMGLLFLNTIGAIFFYLLVAVDFFKAQNSIDKRGNGIVTEQA